MTNSRSPRCLYEISAADPQFKENNNGAILEPPDHVIWKNLLIRAEHGPNGGWHAPLNRDALGARIQAQDL
jgi:hypothetical protein